MVDNTLFTEGLLSEVLRAQVVTMRRAIDGYDANKLLNTNPDELADYFAAKYRLEPPQIVEGGIEADQSETRVDARHSFDRDIRPELGDDPYVPGTLVTVNVRFTGDPDLLKFEPSQRYMGGHALRGKVV